MLSIKLSSSLRGVTPLTVCVHHNASCRVADEDVSPSSHTTTATKKSRSVHPSMEPEAGVAKLRLQVTLLLLLHMADELNLCLSRVSRLRASGVRSVLVYCGNGHTVSNQAYELKSNLPRPNGFPTTRPQTASTTRAGPPPKSGSDWTAATFPP